MFISPKPEKVFDGVREYNPLKDAANEMKRLLKLAKTDMQVAIDLFFLALGGKTDSESVANIKTMMLNSGIPDSFFEHVDRLIVFNQI
ncbi:hypothetical protein OAO18_06560 [Francisellaceae bacterium]|nr:hypothetical protein [Francisellaceae bacterium]